MLHRSSAYMQAVTDTFRILCRRYCTILYLIRPPKLFLLPSLLQLRQSTARRDRWDTHCPWTQNTNNAPLHPALCPDVEHTHVPGRPTKGRLWCHLNHCYANVRQWCPYILPWTLHDMTPKHTFCAFTARFPDHGA